MIIMERSVLEEFNHWWIKGFVDPELALSFKRDIYPTLIESMQNRFIIALTGLRRTGKTTLMYQLIQWLIQSKVNPTDIFFFSFDEQPSGLDEVMESYKEMHNKDFRATRSYIFLDEVQKCGGNWINEIKKYYDLYPRLKFVISGSESLFIRKRTKETLAGRLLEFRIATFSLSEYLRFNGVTKSQMAYETVVKPLFAKFVAKGGFPETFTMQNDREFKEYIRSIVIDKIIYKDIPKTFKVKDPEFLATLLELVASNPGMYIDYQSLAKQFGKDRRVVKSYLDYLMKSFLITMLGNYRRSTEAALRKLKRAYPADTALIYLYKPNPDDSFSGKIVESAVVNGMGAKFFWKGRYEVDIVSNGIPIEIKYQESIGDNDFRQILEFMNKFGVKEGVMVTKNDERIVKHKGRSIKLVPAWKWLLGQSQEL
jgi:predicted AAA+ superfamily ATPase